MARYNFPPPSQEIVDDWVDFCKYLETYCYKEFREYVELLADKMEDQIINGDKQETPIEATK